jgi:hypothetical protein
VKTAPFFFLGLLACSVWACPPTAWDVLDNGRQMRDASTGLIWQRCVIGQQWDGSTCRNEDPLSPLPGKALTYREAMREALWQNEQTKPATPWRVPSEAELRGLLCQNASLPTDKPWPADSFQWFAGPFDLRRGVQVMKVNDLSIDWVGYGDQVLHQLRLVRSQ